MISNQKIVNYKVLLNFNIYNFYFGGSPSEVVWKIQILKFKHSFVWQDDFKPKHCQLQSFITLQYLQLSCWWFFSFEVVFKIQILNFLNSNVVFVDKMTSNEKVANYKILWLLKIYKVYFGCLVICSSHIMILTICTNLIHLSRSFINYERDISFMNKFIFIVLWRNVQNINCTSWWVIQICSWKRFHLN
jgi:hypothetical protein